LHLDTLLGEKAGETKNGCLAIIQTRRRIICEDAGDRVKIGGKAVLYLEGFIHI